MGGSERRRQARAKLAAAGVDPDVVIHSPASARRAGLTGTLVFPVGNLAPQGSVIKATAIDPSVLDADGVLRHRGPARVFTSETAAVDAVKGVAGPTIVAGDVIVLAGIGPLGTGMEETYQLTSALKFLPHGKHVAVVTDGRFSGVSTGACIGHAGPEALAGGPIGRVRDGDVVALEIDTVAPHRAGSTSSAPTATTCRRLTPMLCSRRDPRIPGWLRPPELPDDTRLWAALQAVSGGPWSGSRYDVDRIIELLAAGEAALGDGS